MDLDMMIEVRGVPDVRRRVRQLRWFKASFRHDARLISQRYGQAFEIDDSRLTEAFLNWAEAFSAYKSYASRDRRDFMTFAAGLLLRELLRTRPVRVARGGPSCPAPALSSKTAAIVEAWPDGFLYTNYCLCILAAVLEQEGMSLTLPALADDLRTWWSYRENVGEDPSAAVAFFDLLTGTEPNWFTPDSIMSRRAMTRAMAAQVMPGPDAPSAEATR